MKNLIQLIVGFILSLSLVNCSRPNTAKNLKAKNEAKAKTPVTTNKEDAPTAVKDKSETDEDSATGTTRSMGLNESALTIKSINEMKLIYSHSEVAKEEDDLVVLTALELQDIFKSMDLSKIKQDNGVVTSMSNGLVVKVINTKEPALSILNMSYSLCDKSLEQKAACAVSEIANGLFYADYGVNLKSSKNIGYNLNIEILNLTESSYMSKTAIQITSNEKIQKKLTISAITTMASANGKDYLLVQKVQCDEKAKCLRIFEFNEVIK